MTVDALTYLLVDGENLDATLGTNVLQRRPLPEDRPRWDRVSDWLTREWGQPVKGLFFLNAANGLPTTFVSALLAVGYRPIPLMGEPGDKVVDIAIARTLDALVGRPGDVVLGSHDVDFLPHLRPLLAPRDRRVGLLGFTEFFSNAYLPLRDEGLLLFDIEDDAQAFRQQLPRVRVIPIADFDPLRYL